MSRLALNTIRSRSWMLLPIALMVLWCFEAGAALLLGWRTGLLGALISIGCLVAFVQSKSKRARADVNAIEMATLAEWNTWFGAVVMLAALALLVAQIVLHPAGVTLDPDKHFVPRFLSQLMLMRGALAMQMRSRFEGGVWVDERDREIASRAKTQSRTALIVVLLTGAVILGIVPPEYFPGMSPMLLADLIFVLVLATLLYESIVTLRLYAADRLEAQS